MNNFYEWLSQKQAFVESLLEKNLPRVSHETQLNEAIRYSVLNGGKRMRSLLILATAETLEIPSIAVENIICAVEFIHAYSLVHDDMPCMDNDDLRRGKLSCHKKFGENTALLVGDTLQSIAFSCLSSPFFQVNPDNQLKIINTFSKAIGIEGMAKGQALDIEYTNKKISLDELKTMHQYKTGALINAACLITVLASKDYDKNMLERIDTYSKSIGLMFQIQDDILDKEASQETLGKTPGKDEQYNKSTFVSLLGISKSKELAEASYEEALAAIKPLGNKAYYLSSMAELLMRRSH
jgi:geranylgeranyl pyrophosphate synthase